MTCACDEQEHEITKLFKPEDIEFIKSNAKVEKCFYDQLTKFCNFYIKLRKRIAKDAELGVKTSRTTIELFRKYNEVISNIDLEEEDWQ